MKTKILSILLAALLLVSVVPMAVNAEVTVTASGAVSSTIDWTLYSDGSLVVSGTGNLPNYNWNTQPWFANKDAVISVTFGEGITGIGKLNLSYLTNFTTLSLPSTLETVNGEPINNCGKFTSVTLADGNTAFTLIDGILYTSDFTRTVFVPTLLAGDVTVPDGITSISFNGCKNITSIVLPNTVTNIGEKMFYNCSALTSVTFGNNIQTIGKYVLDYAPKVTRIDLPVTVTSIDSLAFANANGIKTITLPEGNQYYQVITGILYAKADMSKFYIIPKALTGDVVIPDTITAIGGDAFNGRKMSSIYIPSSVKTIGAKAFYGAGTNCKFILNSGLESVSNQAFLYASVKTVIFCGTQEEWSAITFGTQNEYLISNSKAPVQYHTTHEWTNGVCTVCGKVCTHTWEADISTVESTSYICTECGAAKSENTFTSDGVAIYLGQGCGIRGSFNADRDALASYIATNYGATATYNYGILVTTADITTNLDGVIMANGDRTSNMIILAPAFDGVDIQYSFGDTSDNHAFRFALTGFPDTAEAYTKEFVIAGYVTINVGGTYTTLYVNSVTSAGLAEAVGETGFNSVSIRDVATLAIADYTEGTEAYNTLNNIITK